MPWLSKFYGMEMSIDMDAQKKVGGVPHFDAYYTDNMGSTKVARFEITSGNRMEGDLPPTALILAENWRKQSLKDLQQAWADITNGRSYAHIDPLI